MANIKPTKPDEEFSDQLRRFIREFSMTSYELAKRNGVRQSQMSQFLGGRDINSGTIGRLMRPLHQRVVMFLLYQI